MQKSDVFHETLTIARRRKNREGDLNYLSVRALRPLKRPDRTFRILLAIAVSAICLVVGCVVIAVAAITRADSAAIPDVLNEFTSLVNVLV